MSTEPAVQKPPKLTLEQACMLDVGLWARVNKIKLSNSADFSFQKHEYQEEPYRMMALVPILAAKKGSQIGWSELAMLSSIHSCAYKFNTGTIYYLPTDDDVTAFSKQRFNPLLQLNMSSIGPLIRNTNEVHIKRVNGRSNLMFYGLKSKVKVKMIPADKVVFDEVDEADPSQVNQAHQRVEHSPWQWKNYFSTPTLPDFGIDAIYQETDQRWRMIRCEACNHYTCLEVSWPDSIKEDRHGKAYRACVKCGKPLNMSSPKNEWVPQFPGKEIGGQLAVGYWISQLQSPVVNLQGIWEEWKKGPKFLTNFYNHRLAQAHADAQDRLEIEQVLALCSGYGMEQFSQVPTAIGIDVSPAVLYVVVLRPEVNDTCRLIWMGEVKWDKKVNWTGLDPLMHKFRGRAVVDGSPEPERAETWVKRYRQRAWVCTYSNKQAMGYQFHDAPGETGRVKVNQDIAMGYSQNVLSGGKVFLPRRSDKTEEFAKHCHAVMRKKIIDEQTGNYHHSWVKSVNEDHYRRAFNLAVLAMEHPFFPRNAYSGRGERSGLGVVPGGKKRLANSYAA